MFWYKAMSLGAVLSFPLCFASVIAGRIAYRFGYQRSAYACMVVPAIGIAAYWLAVAGLRAYWGDEISCLVNPPNPLLIAPRSASVIESWTNLHATDDVPGGAEHLLALL